MNFLDDLSRWKHLLELFEVAIVKDRNRKKFTYSWNALPWQSTLVGNKTSTQVLGPIGMPFWFRSHKSKNTHVIKKFKSELTANQLSRNRSMKWATERLDTKLRTENQATTLRTIDILITENSRKNGNYRWNYCHKYFLNKVCRYSSKTGISDGSKKIFTLNFYSAGNVSNRWYSVLGIYSVYFNKQA